MAEIYVPNVGMVERHRQAVDFYSSTTVSATAASSSFKTQNITGCTIWFKASSSIGTPDITLSLETSKDDVNANYLAVTPPADPNLPVSIADELVHIIDINLSGLHDYARFKLTLGGGDPGDDVVTMRVTFKYGSMTHPMDVSISSGSEVSVAELPAAATLSDNFANPTTTNIAAMNMIWDGATWDRAPGDSTNGMTVNTELPAAAALADATANPTTTGAAAYNEVFNGTTWDRARSGVTAATGTLTGIQNGLEGGIYNTSKPTATNGQYVPGQCNVNGARDVNEVLAAQAEDNTNAIIATQNRPLAVSTYVWSVDASSALEASSVTKASAGNVRFVSGRIDSTHATASYYFQLINANSVPADGAVTFIDRPRKLQHTNGTDTNFTIDYTDNCINASTGIVWCLSTTEFTKTISGAFVSATVLYK